MDWDRVVRALEQKAAEAQDRANAEATQVSQGSRQRAEQKDEAAYILRAIASALRAGLGS